MMNRLLLFAFLFINSQFIFSQNTEWNIVFDGKSKSSTYSGYDITSENNKLALDFSKLSRNRIPLQLKIPKESQPKYDFSIFSWVKAPKDIEQNSVILTNKTSISSEFWEIRASDNGSWKWVFVKNNKVLREYNATNNRQAINDGDFHLLGFVYDYTKNQVWLYFDGRNVGIINIGTGNMSDFKSIKLAGIEDNEKHSFNGFIKSIHLFKEQLHSGKALGLYRNNYRYSKQIGENSHFYKEVKFLTWNISDGGMDTGIEIGKERSLEILKSSEAEIIALQETNGTGEYFADNLGYYYYSISENLSIISKYPFVRTIKVFKANVSGGAEIAISKKQHVYFFNLSLINNPDWSDFKNKNSDIYYSKKELDSRGGDLKEILEQIKVMIKPTSSTSVVLTGELNSISNVDNREKLVNYPISNLLDSYNYNDSFRELYQNIRVYSGYTSVLPKRKKGRVDYIFYKGSDLMVKDSFVLKHHPIKFTSSHFGVTTSFKWQK